MLDHLELPTLGFSILGTFFRAVTKRSLLLWMNTQKSSPDTSMKTRSARKSMKLLKNMIGRAIDYILANILVLENQAFHKRADGLHIRLIEIKSLKEKSER